MAQTAAHLVERVMPWVPTRQWVVSVPIPLQYWMASSQDLTAKVHTIIRATIGQYYVNQAAKRGIERAKVQPGSVTCIQRFGSAINLNVHYHVIFLEGVYLDRTDQGLTPRLLSVKPPTDTDIADVVQKISHRVIRKLRHLGYLEAGLDAAVATGYDPMVDDEPELARTMAASVQQRIAFGERAGQKVRRIGAGFGNGGEAPTLTGPRCASVHGFSLHATTQLPAHWRDQLERLIRYAARGAAAEARLCGGHGALPMVSVGVAADRRGHHAGRGHQKAPLPSATRGRPAPGRSGACPPSSLRLVLGLTASEVERIRPRCQAVFVCSSA